MLISPLKKVVKVTVLSLEMYNPKSKDNFEFQTAFIINNTPKVFINSFEFQIENLHQIFFDSVKLCV